MEPQMNDTDRIKELEQLCQDLRERVWTLERWAIAHEAEQWQHRIYLADKGSNLDQYRHACQRKAPELDLIPGAKHEPLLQ
jgi:hypothetical protein